MRRLSRIWRGWVMPSNWQQVTLTELYDVSSGLSKPASEFGSGFPFVGFKDVFNNYFLPSELTELVQTSEKEQQKCSVKRGDVFLTRTSETMHELGMSSVALMDYPNATFNGFTKRLRPKKDNNLLPEYVGYYLRSQRFRNEMLAFSTMSTRASLNNSMIGQLKISFPGFNTQRAIAHVLKTLDDKIELNRQMNETLEAMAQALFKSWFVDFDPVIDNALAASNEIPEPLQQRAEARKTLGEQRKPLPPEIQSLFPDRFVFTEEIGWVPETWGTSYLGEKAFSEIIASGVDSFDGTKEYIATAEVIDTKVQSTKTKVSYMERPSRANMQPVFGSVWFAKMKDSRKLLVFDDYSLELDKIILSTGFAGIKTTPVSHDFLWCFIQSKAFDIEKNNLANGAVQIAINNTSIKKISYIRPSDKVLAAFSERVKVLFNKKYLNDLASASLSSIRDGVLPKLLSGELRIPDA